MEKKLSVSLVVPVPRVSVSPAPPTPRSPGAEMQMDVADLRLVIEEDEASGLFIYKTVDRRTGDIVLVLPREEVVRMRAAPDYRAGAVIKTKA